jgi:hypothetical protein
MPFDNGLLMGVGFAGLMFFAAFVLGPSLVVPYVILKIRDGRNPQPDAYLGFKTGVHFLLSVSLMMFLAGVSSLLVDMISGSSMPPGFRRGPTLEYGTGMALSVAGAIFTGAFYAVLRTATDDSSRPTAARTYAGVRLVVCALVVMSVFTGWLQDIFLNDSFFGRTGRTAAAVLLVWVPALAAHVVLMVIHARHRHTDRETPAYRVLPTGDRPARPFELPTAPEPTEPPPEPADPLRGRDA